MAHARHGTPQDAHGGPYRAERVREGVFVVVRAAEVVDTLHGASQARHLAISLNRAFEDGYRAGMADAAKFRK